jgi:mannose/fructose/N-acetylgalactosamine-specific phosphotransferase system component IIB
VTVVLVRVDDRLIHGQVVVGWGQALGATHLVLVDDAVSANEWERDLYRMGVPPDMAVEFASVDEAARRIAEWEQTRRRTILVLNDVAGAVRLCRLAPQVRRVNLGGVHQAPGRRRLLPYVFITDDEAGELRGLAAGGVEVTAQDVPTARPVPIGELV